MRRILSIVLKEFDLIRTRKMTIWLIVAYPILITLILALAFGSSQGVDKVSVSVLVPEQIEGASQEQVNEFVSLLEKNPRVEVLKPLCATRECVENDLKKQFVFVGLVINDKATKAEQIKIDVLLDNSNFATSKIIKSQIQNVIKIIEVNTTKEIISLMLGKLDQVNQNLSGEVGKIDGYLDELNKSGDKLNQLESNVNRIDADKINRILDFQSQNVSNVDSTVNDFKADLTKTETDVQKLQTETSNARNELFVYEGKVDSSITDLEDLEITLLDIRNTLNNAEQTFKNEPNTLATIRDLQRENNKNLAKVQSALIDLRNAKTKIRQADDKLIELQNVLTSTNIRVQDGKNRLTTLGFTIDTFKNDLSDLNKEAGALTETIDSTRALVSDGRTSKDALTLRLQDSKTLIQDFSNILKQLSDRDPKFIAQPIIVKEQLLYKDVTVLGILTPIVLSIVLLLTCLLLSSFSAITEDKQGAFLRMRLSSTTQLKLVFGKVLGQILIAFVIALIILVYAFTKINLPFPVFGYDFIGFGITPTITKIFIGLIGVGLAALTFVSLGLFISNFTKNESTAILGSLLLVIPMIFLSGIIFPLDFIAPLIKLFTSILPLTIVNNLFTEIFIKDSYSIFTVLEIIALLMMSGFFLSTTVIKNMFFSSG